jgi:hypothetical protein
MEDFECNHSEADTILLFIYSQMKNTNTDDIIVIDAEDTDVVVLCAYAAHRINGTLGLKRKTAIYDCKELCSKEISDVIIPLHVNSGADAISSFYGHGKASVFAKGTKTIMARTLLSSVGVKMPASKETIEKLKLLTLRFIYNDSKSNTLGEARAKRLMAMKKKSTACIPPDEESHNLRAEQVNYQAYVWLHFDQPDAPPSPLNHGWQLFEGNCVPIRHKSPALPQRFEEIVDQPNELGEDKSDSETDDDVHIDSAEEESDRYTDSDKK